MPESPTALRPVVAVFDLDGTLTTRDCVTPFLWRAVRWRLLATLVTHPLALASAGVRRDRDRVKKLACSTLREIEGAAIDRLGATFAQHVAAHWLREDTTARLRRHRELGHTTILGSASLDAYARPLGRLLEVDDVVCTQLERGPDGRLTGRLAGRNCRGPEKARRVHEWLAGAGLERAVVWAYGDSRDDRPLLEAADHPVWVDDGRLEAEPH